MQLLCLGDIAILDKSLPEWEIPGQITPGDEQKILFNMEFPLGDRINPVPRVSGVRLVSEPILPQVIKKWAPGFAALATNHILDAGAEALPGLIETLNQAGFVTFGAGKTQAEIEKPLIWEAKEGRVAVINWVFAETHPDWMTVPGPNCWPGLEKGKQAIRALKKQADWVILVLHWSDELFEYPRPADRDLAQAFAEAGADVIIGHHPHVVRGMETFGNCPVFYSIGNFYFSDIPANERHSFIRQAPRNCEGLGIQVIFRRGQKPECQPLSFWRENGQTLLDPQRRAEKRMQQTSRAFQKYQNSRYAPWYANQRGWFNRIGYRLHFRLWKLGPSGLFQHILRRLKKNLYPVPVSTKLSR